MIKTFYAKELVGFREVNLEFLPGLNVFSGPSGAGKSILIDCILSTIGLSDAKAAVAQTQTEDAIFMAVKKEKSRWFYNDEPIAKKILSDMASDKILYLSANDSFAFSRHYLLAFLDDETKDSFNKAYIKYAHVKETLSQLKVSMAEVEQRREFLAFEIAKIENINPKLDEDQELLSKKKAYSQREKLQTALNKTAPILNSKSVAFTIFETLGLDKSICENFFTEFEDAVVCAQSSLAEPDNIDKIMNRLDELSYLTKKYGGISEALEVKSQKTKELLGLDNIKDNLTTCEINEKKAAKEMMEEAQKLSEYRKKAAKDLQIKTNKFLNSLKLNDCEIVISQTKPDNLGIDDCLITLGGVKSDKISSGEARRLRLALYAATVSAKKKVIILDEADSNLSGAESAGVAGLLKILAKKYQLFAITHQAQTAAIAEAHFLVTKDNDGSSVKMLTIDERVNEVARMLSGEEIQPKALELASLLLGINTIHQ